MALLMFLVSLFGPKREMFKTIEMHECFHLVKLNIT